MFSSLSNLTAVAFNLLHVLVPLAGGVVLLTRVVGPRRWVGLIGCALLVLTGVVQTISILTIAQLTRSTGGLGVYAAINLVNGVLGTLGLALVIAAACMSGREPSLSPTPGSAGSWPGSPPQ